MSPVSCPVVHAEKKLVIIISKKQAYSLNLLLIHVRLTDIIIRELWGRQKTYYYAFEFFFGVLFLSNIHSLLLFALSAVLIFYLLNSIIIRLASVPT